MAMGMVSFILDTMRSLLTHICRKDFPFSIRKLAGLEGEIVQRVLHIIRLVVGRFLDNNPLFRKYLRHRVVIWITRLAAVDHSGEREISWSSTRPIVVPVRKPELLCCLPVVILVL